jgi:hypothetical protein
MRQALIDTPPDIRQRFAILEAKRRDFTLMPEEHTELLRLNDEFEAQTVRRLKALTELAQLRHTTVSALMKRLGLKAPPVV